jgi:hypothetical protein
LSLITFQPDGRFAPPLTPSFPYSAMIYGRQTSGAAMPLYGVHNAGFSTR